MVLPTMEEARIKFKDREKGIIQCLECGTEWVDWGYKLAQTRQRRRGDWWKCPMGCNADVMEDFPPPGEIEGGS